jgi:serine protease
MPAMSSRPTRSAARPVALFKLAASILGVSVALTSLSAQARDPRQEEVRRHLRDGRPHVQEEVLVQFRATADTAAQTRTLVRHRGTKVTDLRRKAERLDRKGDLALVRLPRGKAMEAALNELELDDNVEFVEPNWVYTTQQVVSPTPPNDPNVANLWGMLGATTSPSNPNGSGALALWTAGLRCDAAVHVGVIDEGVMTTHPDLRNNIWANAQEATVNRVDNDTNGYIDDTNGWDFDGRNRTVYDGPADDHGSHVAGTIAATANNAAGVYGVCPTAKIITAKFLGVRGGTTANAVAAVKYITDLKVRKGLRIVATNNSWGGGGYSQALFDAIKAAGDQNILFVAAAGNSNQNIDTLPSYPASYDLPNVIAVAAIDATGNRASFSSYGATRVHIAAPGVNILSTVPTARGAASYAYYSGTSMATPHVTGAAAMFASLNPTATAAQIKEALLCSAAAAPQLVGYVNGARRLDISSFRAGFTCPVAP